MDSANDHIIHLYNYTNRDLKKIITNFLNIPCVIRIFYIHETSLKPNPNSRNLSNKKNTKPLSKPKGEAEFSDNIPNFILN
jgi:hypothetical protein